MEDEIGTARIENRSFERFPSAQYFYALRVITRAKQESPLVRLVGLNLRPPPPPPQHLTAEVTPESIDLCWETSETLPAKHQSQAQGYNVYRVEGSGTPWDPHNPALIESTCFQDRQFQFDTHYTYTVRVVLSTSPHLIESRSSSPCSSNKKMSPLSPCSISRMRPTPSNSVSR